MINLSTKFKIPISTCYTDMQADAKCRVVNGHLRSLAIAPFDRLHVSSY